MKNVIPQISKNSNAQHLYPLSFSQQHFLYSHKIDPNSVHNMSIGIHIIGKLDISLFEEAQKKLIKRHNILKTCYKNVQSEIYQTINLDAAVDWHMEISDFSKISTQPVTMENAIVEAKRLAKLPLALNQIPLFKSYLLILGKDDYIWLLNIHHSIFDDHSQSIFLKELSDLYNSGLKQPLVTPAIDYKDYAYWQKHYLAPAVFEEQLQYWEKTLEGSVPFKLTEDYIHTTAIAYLGEREKFYLSPKIQNALQVIAKDNDTSIFAVLLTAFNCLLFHFSGETDITIATITTNRNRKEIKNQVKNILGYFSNTIIIRTNLSANPLFTELVKKTKNIILNANANSDIPFDKIASKLNPSTKLSNNPLFNILFILQDKNYHALNLKETNCIPLEHGTNTAKTDLVLEIHEDQHGLTGFFEYNTQLFSQSTIKNFIQHFITLLTNIAADPNKNLFDLQLNDTSDILAWNELNKIEDYNYNKICIHELIEQKAHQHKYLLDTAILFCNPNNDIKSINYKELTNAVNWLAKALLDANIVPKTPIGICLPRSLEMIIALLAILKIGCIAVPLEIRPIEIELILHKLEDARISVIVSNVLLANLTESLLKIKTDLTVLDYYYHPNYLDENLEFNVPKVSPEDIAYIEYTSGTTGFPKGIPIQHKALTNWANFLNKYSIDNFDKIYLSAPLTFDASLWEILCLTLSQGAQLAINNEEERLDTNALTALFNKLEITIATFTPTMLRQLFPAQYSTLKLIIATGENLSYEDIEPWLEAGVYILNGYGPTEIGIGLTMGEFKKLKKDSTADFITKPHIGRPIPNTCLYILNDNHQLAPIGAFGQIAVGGIGLTPGYLNLDKLNESSFKTFTISNKNIRLYLTGDKGRLLPTGYIDIRGRINQNQQIKMNGVRIELANVKTLLCKHPAIAAAEILPVNSNNKSHIACFIVLNSNNHTNVSAKEFTSFLLKLGFPPQGLPLSYFLIPFIPLTNNGKVDTKELMHISTDDLNRIHNSFEEPKTELEIELARLYQSILELHQEHRISVNAHFFFDLGGSSILASKLRGKIFSQYGTFPALSDFLNDATIAYLSRHIMDYKHGQVLEQNTISVVKHKAI